MHGMVTTPLYLPMDRQVLANPGLLLAMAPTKVSIRTISLQSTTV